MSLGTHTVESSHAAPRRSAWLLCVVLWLWMSPGTFAAEFELAPYFSYRLGGVELPAGVDCSPLNPEACSERVETEPSLAWGLGFSMELQRGWWLEVRFSEQVAEVDSALDSELSTSSTEASWDRYLVGLEYRTRGERKWTPAWSVGGGWTSLSPDVATPGADTGLTHPTVEVGAGLLLDRGQNLGLRFESRLSWTSLPADLGDDIYQLGVGVSFRWRTNS